MKENEFDTMFVSRQTFVDENLEERTNYCINIKMDYIDEISLAELEHMYDMIGKVLSRDLPNKKS